MFACLTRGVAGRDQAPSGPPSKERLIFATGGVFCLMIAERRLENIFCYHEDMTKRYTDEQNKQWQANLPKKKVAVKVILRSTKGNILLIKPDYKDTWQLPGGGVEAYEDPKRAAVREAEEETGVKIEVGDLRLIDSAFKSKEDYLFLLFECAKLYAEEADYSVEDEEIEDYKFVDPSEVAALLPGYYADVWKDYVART